MNERMESSENIANQETFLNRKKFLTILGDTQRLIDKYSDANSEHGKRNDEEEIVYEQFKTYFHTIKALADYHQKTRELPRSWVEADLPEAYGSQSLPVLKEDAEGFYTVEIPAKVPADLAVEVGLLSTQEYSRALRRSRTSEEQVQREAAREGARVATEAASIQPEANGRQKSI